MLANSGHEPAEAGLGVGQGTHTQEGFDDIGCIAHPGKPVVPVLVAADALGQRGTHRRSDGTGRREPQELQGKRGADYLGAKTGVAVQIIHPLVPFPVRAVNARIDLLQRRHRQHFILRRQKRDNLAVTRMQGEATADFAVIAVGDLGMLGITQHRHHRASVMHTPIRRAAQPRRAGTTAGTRLVDQVEGRHAFQTLYPPCQLRPWKSTGGTAVEGFGNQSGARGRAHACLQHVAAFAVRFSVRAPAARSGRRSAHLASGPTEGARPCRGRTTSQCCHRGR